MVGQDGEVPTERRLLVGASRAEITTAEGRTFPVQQIREDLFTDLALLTTELRSPTVYLPLNTSELYWQEVYVVGGPFALQERIFHGEIYTVYNIPFFGELGRINLALSSFWRGSPVVDARGQLLGLLTVLTQAEQNVSLMVPTAQLQGVVSKEKEDFSEWVKRTNKDLSQQNYFSDLRCFLLQGDYEQALPLLKKIRKLEPENVELFFTEGYLYHNLGQMDKANEVYDRILTDNPGYEDALFFKGVAHYQAQEYEQALTVFTQAATINPDSPHNHYYLGVTYRGLGEREKAVAAFRRALACQPDHYPSLDELAFTYFDLRRYLEAFEVYQQILRLDPENAKAYYYLGLIFYETGRPEEAIWCYEKTLAVSPEFIWAIYELGYTYFQLGDYPVAGKYLKDFVAREPEYAYAITFWG